MANLGTISHEYQGIYRARFISEHYFRNVGQIHAKASAEPLNFDLFKEICIWTLLGCAVVALFAFLQFLGPLLFWLMYDSVNFLLPFFGISLIAAAAVALIVGLALFFYAYGAEFFRESITTLEEGNKAFQRENFERVQRQHLVQDLGVLEGTNGQQVFPPGIASIVADLARPS